MPVFYQAAARTSCDRPPMIWVPSRRRRRSERFPDEQLAGDLDALRLADEGRPNAESSLHLREAPPCHIHRTSPFGPQQQHCDFQRDASPGYCQFGCSLDQGEGTLARSLVVGTCAAKAGSGGNERADCARRDSHAALIGHRAPRGRLCDPKAGRLARNITACGTG